MRSPEAGRPVAPERQKKSSIITRTIASGLAIGAVLFTGCQEPRTKGLVATSTGIATPIEQDLKGVKLHCIVLPKEEKSILDHEKFKCDAEGKPTFTGYTPTSTPSESTPVASQSNQDGS